MIATGIAKMPRAAIAGPRPCMMMESCAGSMRISYPGGRAPGNGHPAYNVRMAEAHLELTRIRCPRCAGQIVLRVLGEERGGAVELTLDSACVVCGTSPWGGADQRTLVF